MLGNNEISTPIIVHICRRCNSPTPTRTVMGNVLHRKGRSAASIVKEQVCSWIGIICTIRQTPIRDDQIVVPISIKIGQSHLQCRVEQVIKLNGSETSFTIPEKPGAPIFIIGCSDHDIKIAITVNIDSMSTISKCRCSIQDWYRLNRWEVAIAIIEEQLLGTIITVCDEDVIMIVIDKISNDCSPRIEISTR